MRRPIGIETAPDRERVGRAVEADDLKHGLDRRMRRERRQVPRAGRVGTGDQHVGAPGDRILDSVVNAFPGLVRLTKHQQRKPGSEQRHRAMPKLGGAERLAMQATGFLELERRLLRDAEPQPAPDHI